jgi:hypothetical protein
VDSFPGAALTEGLHTQGKAEVCSRCLDTTSPKPRCQQSCISSGDSREGPYVSAALSGVGWHPWLSWLVALSLQALLSYMVDSKVMSSRDVCHWI